MLPNEEEIENKLNELIEFYKHDTDHWADQEFTECNVSYIAKKYTKWYTEQVVKHCAEVAKISLGEGKVYCHECGSNGSVDKQSILNVINEL